MPEGGAKHCFVFLRAGPILSVSNSLSCFHCFELVRKAWGKVCELLEEKN